LDYSIAVVLPLLQLAKTSDQNVVQDGRLPVYSLQLFFDYRSSILVLIQLD